MTTHRLHVVFGTGPAGRAVVPSQLARGEREGGGIVSLVNPVTGERMTVESPAREAGDASRVRFDLPANQGGPPAHYHDRYDESFEVLSGELALVVDGVRRVLRAGECATVRRGVAHSFANESTAPVTFRTTASDGAGFERFVRGWYGLAIDGRSGVNGPRHPLELAVLLDEGDINLPLVPRALQRAIRRALVAVARRTGALYRVLAWW